MRIFHIATLADWQEATRTGRYTTSTYGVTLAEEGFIHASRADQWQAVRERWYAGASEPLVLLVVDTDRLSAPVVEEPAPGTTETFPHVYGAIETSAVVQVLPLDGPGARAVDASFSRLFLGELVHRVVLASIVLVAVAVLAVVGDAVVPLDGWGVVLGTAVGLLVGTPIAVAVARRRERALSGLLPPS
ncbi:DUF952 domain-containing protein [Nocardioides deserti]|uniref:DUF952 domain-containing protein n=1 Tax=Nocardioides deserti TaxID=1588644 RepID=A0ABR6U8D9_9ACTN|nr:DUF952 domain-containing protein [Nocardioides deserti]MBC2960702.1 DUF952 domain-containing protein [Nocardioides deserti]GGO77124.1 hypothetical protein GCM10012276_31430 [Nocardioides deserti]